MSRSTRTLLVFTLSLVVAGVFSMLVYQAAQRPAATPGSHLGKVTGKDPRARFTPHATCTREEQGETKCPRGGKSPRS